MMTDRRQASGLEPAEPRRTPGVRRRRPRIATLLSFPVSHPGGISTFVRGMLGALERDYCVEHELVTPPAEAPRISMFERL